MVAHVYPFRGVSGGVCPVSCARGESDGCNDEGSAPRTPLFRPTATGRPTRGPCPLVSRPHSQPPLAAQARLGACLLGPVGACAGKPRQNSTDRSAPRQRAAFAKQGPSGAVHRNPTHCARTRTPKSVLVRARTGAPRFSASCRVSGSTADLHRPQREHDCYATQSLRSGEVGGQMIDRTAFLGPRPNTADRQASQGGGFTEVHSPFHRASLQRVHRLHLCTLLRPGQRCFRR